MQTQNETQWTDAEWREAKKVGSTNAKARDKLRAEFVELIPEWIKDNMTQAALHDMALSWNSKHGEPFYAYEIMALLDAAWDKYHKMKTENLNQDTQDTTAPSRLKLTNLIDIYSYANPEYSINEILIKNSLTLLTGYSGSGKSLLLLNIIYSLLENELLFNHYQPTDKQQHKVLLIDEENPGSFLKDRLLRLGFADHAIQFLHFQGVKLDEVETFSELLEIIETEKPSVIAFDSLVRIHNKKENDAEMSRVMEKLRQIVNLGITVILLHHEGKTENANKKKTARGSSDIVAAADAVMNIEEKEGHIILSNPKNRCGESFPPIKLRLNTDSLKFEYIGHHLTESAEILNEIKDILQNEDKLGAKELLARLKDNGTELGINKLRLLLTQAALDRILKEEVGLRGKKEYSIV